MSVRMQLVPDGGANRRTGSKPVPPPHPPPGRSVTLPGAVATHSFLLRRRVLSSSLTFAKDDVAKCGGRGTIKRRYVKVGAHENTEVHYARFSAMPIGCLRRALHWFYMIIYRRQNRVLF